MANIVIIGGGVTGLSAGIHLLSAEGGHHRVTICEAHKIAGGNLTGWDRGGCHIDNCIHWLTGTNPSTDMYRMWCRLGALGGVELRRLETLFTCRHGTQSLSLYRDMERTRQAMLSVSPQDSAEIDRFFRAVKIMQGVCGLAGAQHDKKASPVATILSVPELLRYHRMSTGELADRFHHPLLRQFMNALCGNCFAATSLLTVVAHFCGENADLPAGGSTAMAERMSKRFTALGGHLLLGRAVETVHLSDASGQGHPRKATSVSLVGGATLPADYVIITADPRCVCGQMLDAPLPHGLEKKYHAPGAIRFSGLHAAFAAPAGSLSFSGDLVMDIPHDDQAALGRGQVILREFSHEPGFAPAQEVVVQATVFCSEATARRFIHLAHTPTDYQKQKIAMADAFRRILTGVCPGTQGQLRLLDVWTPATYRRFVGSEIGSFMSFVLRPMEDPRRMSGRIPGVTNVRLAGQWLHAPGGLPIAAEEGRRAAIQALRSRAVRSPAKQKKDGAARVTVSFS